MWKEIACPKCFGDGKIENFLFNGKSGKKYYICPVCNGFRVIKQKTFGNNRVENITETEKNKNKFKLLDL